MKPSYLPQDHWQIKHILPSQQCMQHWSDFATFDTRSVSRSEKREINGNNNRRMAYEKWRCWKLTYIPYSSGMEDLAGNAVWGSKHEDASDNMNSEQCRTEAYFCKISLMKLDFHWTPHIYLPLCHEALNFSLLHRHLWPPRLNSICDCRAGLIEQNPEGSLPVAPHSTVLPRVSSSPCSRKIDLPPEHLIWNDDLTFQNR